jgi:hypothetical protein
MDRRKQGEEETHADALHGDPEQDVTLPSGERAMTSIACEIARGGQRAPP